MKTCCTPYNDGVLRGVSAASWIGIDSEDHARRLLQGIEDIDPEILDAIQPPYPLSGENGGESMIELLGEDFTEDDVECYEMGFDDGFWDTIGARCQAYLR